jgi:ferritin-like metal-binding protein YciE
VPGHRRLLKEGDDLMGEVDGEDVMNVGIVAEAQAVPSSTTSPATAR